MKTIEYRATYAGQILRGPAKRAGVIGDPTEEIIRVQARDINAGFGKALARTRERLGNGRERELARLEFWQVV